MSLEVGDAFAMRLPGGFTDCGKMSMHPFTVTRRVTWVGKTSPTTVRARYTSTATTDDGIVIGEAEFETTLKDKMHWFEKMNRIGNK